MGLHEKVKKLFVMQLSKMSQNSQILIFKIEPNQADHFFVFIVFTIAQNAISQKPIAQSPWGFHLKFK